MRTIRFIKRLHLDTHLRLSLTLTQEPAELCTETFSDHWQNYAITFIFISAEMMASKMKERKVREAPNARARHAHSV